LRVDLLQIRAAYIHSLHQTQDVAKLQENIDPDFNLQFGNTCDVVFLDLEPHKALFATKPKLTLATTLPAEGDMDLLIAYHYAGPWKVQELREEYAATIAPPNASSLYFADYRTVSLGKVMKVGTGLITDISTLEEMSGGGPKLFVEGGELHVFGISVGSFYDEPSSNKSPPDWTLVASETPLLVDIQLPEKGRSTIASSKNRNVIVGIHHSCVKEMLAHI